MLKNTRKNLIFGFVFLTLFLGCSTNSYAQVPSKPLTVCELMKNKKKYNGKTVLVEGVIDFGFETATFRTNENCPDYESISIGVDPSLESNKAFRNATDLLGLQAESDKKFGAISRYSTLIRLKIRAYGNFLSSRKRKYGHLESYKNAFIITDVKEYGQSQLILVNDMFSKNPKILVSRENN